MPGYLGLVGAAAAAAVPDLDILTSCFALTSPGTAQRLGAISTTDVLVYCNGDRVVSVDVSTPTAPVERDSYSDLVELADMLDISTLGSTAALVGKELFANNSWLTMVNGSDPDNLAVYSFTSVTGAAFSAVDLAGSYAYIVDSRTGAAHDNLRIYNVSNPASPSLTGQLSNTLLSQASWVRVVGSYAFVGSSLNDRITVVDVSNPASPSVVTDLTDAVDLDQTEKATPDPSGDYLYTSTNDVGTRRLTVVDISSPTSPSVAGGVTSANIGAQAHPASTSGFVYVGTVNSFSSFDARVPSAPVVFETITDTDLGAPTRVDLVGSVLVAICNDVVGTASISVFSTGL